MMICLRALISSSCFLLELIIRIYIPSTIIFNSAHIFSIVIVVSSCAIHYLAGLQVGLVTNWLSYLIHAIPCSSFFPFPRSVGGCSFFLPFFLQCFYFAQTLLTKLLRASQQEPNTTYVVNTEVTAVHVVVVLSW